MHSPPVMTELFRVWTGGGDRYGGNRGVFMKLVQEHLENNHCFYFILFFFFNEKHTKSFGHSIHYPDDIDYLL